MTRETTTTVTLRLTQAEGDALDAVAALSGQRRSRVATAALIHWLRDELKRPEVEAMAGARENYRNEREHRERVLETFSGRRLAQRKRELELALREANANCDSAERDRLVAELRDLHHDAEHAS